MTKETAAKIVDDNFYTKNPSKQENVSMLSNILSKKDRKKSIKIDKSQIFLHIKGPEISRIKTPMPNVLRNINYKWTNILL